MCTFVCVLICQNAFGVKNPDTRMYTKVVGEIELLGLFGNAHNITLDFQVGNGKEYFEVSPPIYVGGYATLPTMIFDLMESTVRLVWYTPCSLKYPRWSHFFHIFSVHMILQFIWAETDGAPQNT